MHQRSFTACIVLALVAVAGWPGSVSTAAGAETRTRVVTTLFPLYDFARNIGRDKVDVVLLVPPGVEPHAFEPKPSDMVKIAQADVFIYTGKAMEPWAEKIIASLGRSKLRVVDSSKGIALMKRDGGETGVGAVKSQAADPGPGRGPRGVDPHIWLDFANAQQMVDSITDALVMARPADEAVLRQNAETYKNELRALDHTFAVELAKCPKREFIQAGHYAFGYLARRYHLTYMAAQGFDPDSEPTAKQLAALTQQIKSAGLNVVFYEELVEPRIARTVAKETGAELLMLNGAHNLSREAFEKGQSFIDIMQANLINLKRGLGCQP
jgi:zinc transport system substrate-binding protein